MRLMSQVHEVAALQSRLFSMHAEGRLPTLGGETFYKSPVLVVGLLDDYHVRGYYRACMWNTCVSLSPSHTTRESVTCQVCLRVTLYMFRNCVGFVAKADWSSCSIMAKRLDSRLQPGLDTIDIVRYPVYSVDIHSYLFEAQSLTHLFLLNIDTHSAARLPISSVTPISSRCVDMT